MEQIRTAQEPISHLMDGEGRLLVFSRTRADIEQSKQEFNLLADMISAGHLPVGNTVLYRQEDIQAVRGSIPDSLDELYYRHRYQAPGGNENSTIFAGSFAEGTSFAGEILKSNPQLLVTLDSLFRYQTNVNQLQVIAANAGIQQQRRYQNDPKNMITYVPLITDLKTDRENLAYFAFLQGMRSALLSARLKFQESQPIRNHYLENAGLSDAAQKPDRSHLEELEKYYALGERAAYLSGLIEESILGRGRGTSEAFSVMRQIDEKIFSHEQTGQPNFVEGYIDQRLCGLHHHYDSLNSYERYDNWFITGRFRISLGQIFPHLSQFEAESLEQMLREDSPYLFSGVSLDPNIDWYGGDRNREAREKQNRSLILQAHSEEYWDKNALWQMWSSSDSAMLTIIDIIKGRFKEQLDRVTNFGIPEDPAARVGFVMEELKYSWWEFRYFSELNKRLFVAKYLLPDIEFGKYIADWQEEIHRRTEQERGFILTRVLVEDQINEMGWRDLYDEQGRIDLDRFDDRVPFWVDASDARTYELEMMRWEKIKRLVRYYNLLPEQELPILDEIAGMFNSW